MLNNFCKFYTSRFYSFEPRAIRGFETQKNLSLLNSSKITQCETFLKVGNKAKRNQMRTTELNARPSRVMPSRRHLALI